MFQGSNFKISIASGKGGTGKTTIATNLALAFSQQGYDITYVDCDVEEPNGRIFLKPKIKEQFNATVPVPVIDSSKCTLCGECSKACEYHAIAVLGKTVEVFSSLCHGCGGCSDVCPEDAIKEVPRVIGIIEHGIGMNVSFYEGRLNVGEAISPPVTKKLRELSKHTQISILDAPPGTSCPTIEAIHDTDFVVLVTEPTPFGLNDLILAVEMVRELGLPFGVLINRSDIGNNKTIEYCRRENIDILLQIPFDRKAAEAYSRGEMIVDLDDRYKNYFNTLIQKIEDMVHHERTNCN